EVYKRGNGSLGHKVYRKPTHTDLHLNKGSFHYPSQKHTVLSTFIHRAIKISDMDSLPGDINHLCTTFKQNDYTNRDINSALKRKKAFCG
ncbi:hypothetical protein C0J52_05292, partial [Blattella germanica]